MNPTRSNAVLLRPATHGSGLLVALLLTACGTDGGASPTTAAAVPEPGPVHADAPGGSGDAPTAAGDAGRASFESSGVVYEFSLTMCLVGETDILAQGPGSDARSGEPAFLDVDLTQHDGEFVGGVDVELGVDAPFSSPDTYYRLDPMFNRTDYAVELTDDGFRAEGVFELHGQAPPPADGAGPGVLDVQCPAP